ncbi:MAG: hypothetical protein WDW36_007548 [Sanguina aurantia]
MPPSPRPKLFHGGPMGGVELDQTKKSYLRLSKTLEGTEVKLGEFRTKLRDARQELGSRERQLDVARRLLVRLGDEKVVLEVGRPRPGGRRLPDIAQPQWRSSQRLSTLFKAAVGVYLPPSSAGVS